MKELTLSANESFDLDCTLACGQLFRWDCRQGWWQGVVGHSVVRIRQLERQLEFEGADKSFIRQYFQLDLDLDAILGSIDKDPVIHDAILLHHGLRLIRQEPWECLISYICAQNANIPFIRRMITNMADMYGESISTPVGEGKCFPQPDVLASLEEPDLRGCSLGYRSPYVLDTARRIAADSGWAGRIEKMGYVEAKEVLMDYRGVGPKVADCILLFAFQKFEAFPVDVWIRKVMYRHYLKQACEKNSLGCREYRFIGDFARQYFGNYAGYAQEYLYAATRGV